MTGALHRRGRQCKASQPSLTSSQLDQWYLIPKEVNERPVISKWRFKWEPAQAQVRPKQEVRQLGWEALFRSRRGKFPHATKT